MDLFDILLTKYLKNIVSPYENFEQVFNKINSIKEYFNLID